MSLLIGTIVVLVALASGVCITTIGPGGIFVTIALFRLVGLSPGTVAGTASVAFIATGLLGSAAYLRSGELRSATAMRAATVLSGASIVGAFSGAWLNTRLDAASFGALLGLFVAGTGVLLLAQEDRAQRKATFAGDMTLPGETRLLGIDAGQSESHAPSSDSWFRLLAMGAVGVGVGLPAGLLGLGGPVLAVPALVLLRLPFLMAVALAQVQSIFISAFAALGYALQGVIDWWLALLVVIPLLAGTGAGWWLAHRIPIGRLKRWLAMVLLLIGVYLLTVDPGMK